MVFFRSLPKNFHENAGEMTNSYARNGEGKIFYKNWKGGALHLATHQCFRVFAVAWIDSSAQVSWSFAANISLNLKIE